jgi:transcriptional regulator with XRE-family HTH domain
VKDHLDKLIDEFAEVDSSVGQRVTAALERRELARRLADGRRDAGLTQSELAKRMGTSQGQVTRFESGADTRLSTVARYAAAIGMKVEWSVAPVVASGRSGEPAGLHRVHRGGRIVAVALIRLVADATSTHPRTHGSVRDTSMVTDRMAGGRSQGSPP